MGSSSYLQNSFLGGEWAPEIQGRSETDGYKAGLNVCTNYLPIEQGSLLRRKGFTFVGHTKAGVPGRVFGFDITAQPLQLEFTNGWVRFITGNSFLANGISDILSISTATPAGRRLSVMASAICWVMVSWVWRRLAKISTIRSTAARGSAGKPLVPSPMPR